jgi:hypothetical protein
VAAPGSCGSKTNFYADLDPKKKQVVTSMKNIIQKFFITNNNGFLAKVRGDPDPHENLQDPQSLLAALKATIVVYFT